MVAWRTVFFSVNFGLAVGMVAVCVGSFVEVFAGGGSPWAFLGGICFIVPAAGCAIAEWALYFRKSPVA